MNVAAALSEADAARAIRLSTRRGFGVVAGAFSIMFVTFGTAGSALGSFTFGSLADRIGRRSLLAAVFAGLALMPPCVSSRSLKLHRRSAHCRTSFCVSLAAARRSRRS